MIPELVVHLVVSVLAALMLLVCRWFLRWFDKEPLAEVRQQKRAEVNAILARRQDTDSDAARKRKGGAA